MKENKRKEPVVETKTYGSIDELFEALTEHGCIHIECNKERSEEILAYAAAHKKGADSSFLISTDKGYERTTVKEYLRFFRELYGYGHELEEVMHAFGLTGIRRQKMGRLKQGDYTKIGMARLAMRDTDFYFIEEPLLNLEEEDMRRVLEWMESRCEAGASFVTTNSSMRHAIMMPGTAFFLEDGRFCQVEQDTESEEGEAGEVEILKIPVKSGESTLLFDPRDIDYIESLNKCVYVSVRGTLFQTQKTMYELEEELKKAGFFRCHRSYLVNIQKVERLEKWTKNSYVLILDNGEKSQIPLSKGRIDELKEEYHW